MESTRKILGLTILTLLLTSCSISSSDQSQLLTNRHVYGIDCSGSAASMSICYKKAESMCPDGYKVISKQEVHPSPTGNTLLTEPSTGNPALGMSVKREINIVCQ